VFRTPGSVDNPKYLGRCKLMQPSFSSRKSLHALVYTLYRIISFIWQHWLTFFLSVCLTGITSYPLEFSVQPLRTQGHQPQRTPAQRSTVCVGNVQRGTFIERSGDIQRTLSKIKCGDTQGIFREYLDSIQRTYLGHV
jgi:hypothetical protein